MMQPDYQFLRNQFSFLKNNPELIYFDSAATSLVPKTVIEAEIKCYQEGGASPFRGSSSSAKNSSDLFQCAKIEIADFFGARPEEFIPVTNTTQAINGIACGWAERNMRRGDKIVLSVAEHHSNIVPWQVLIDKIGIEILWCEIDQQSGVLKIEQLKEFINDKKVRLLSLTHMSNVLGIINPVDLIAKIIKKENHNRANEEKIRLLVDGAQTAAWHMNNFDQSGIDFYAFSGHKMYASNSAGGVLVKLELIRNGELYPWVFGGGMVGTVSQQNYSLNKSEERRFQAGTPNLSALISLAKAITFIKKIGREEAIKYLSELTKYAQSKFSGVGYFELLCPNVETEHILTYRLQKGNIKDISNFLDLNKISIREGFHCAQPLYDFLNVPGGIRFSFSPFNSKDEIDRLSELLYKAKTRLCYN